MSVIWARARPLQANDWRCLRLADRLSTPARRAQAAREITERDQRASERETAKLKALRLARDAEAELAVAPAKEAKR